MLKEVTINTKADGSPVTIPVSMNEAKIEQQVKRFIEITDDSSFDGHLHISVFRACHGSYWTLKILEAIVQELKTPSIVLNIRSERESLLPFFIHQLERHQNLEDTDFRFSGPPPKLPI